MATNKIEFLIREISANNCQQSFKQLFDYFYPRLFEQAKYFVKINHVAEEIVSDVFVKFWKTRAEATNIQNLKSYFFVAVKRQSLNYLRTNNSNLFYIDSLEHQIFVESKTPEKDVFSQEYLDYIARCIQRLPEKCQLVFKMVKEDQMAYKQVAEILGISIKTVEMHISNATKQLRIDIEKYKNYHQNSQVK